MQLTDGEVSLRPANKVIEILRHACKIELIPMLMSHGDGFLRNPDLRKRLMVEGGLEELSLHIDTTQRGRRDREFKYATREAKLIDLRARIMAMIRRVHREAGRSIPHSPGPTHAGRHRPGQPKVSARVPGQRSGTGERPNV